MYKALFYADFRLLIESAKTGHKFEKLKKAHKTHFCFSLSNPMFDSSLNRNTVAISKSSFDLFRRPVFERMMKSFPVMEINIAVNRFAKLFLEKNYSAVKIILLH